MLNKNDFFVDSLPLQQDRRYAVFLSQHTQCSSAKEEDIGRKAHKLELKFKDSVCLELFIHNRHFCPYHMENEK